MWESKKNKKNETFEETYPVMKRIFSSSIQNWESITLNSMQFFFQQAEKFLDNTKSISNSLDSKAMGLLTANTAFLLPLLGGGLFLIQRNIWGLLLFAGVASLCFIISMVLCFLSFSPGDITCSGSAPRYLMDPRFINETQKGDVQVLQIMMDQCEAYQDRIDINHRRNKCKATQIIWAAILTCAAPLLGGLVFFLYFKFFCNSVVNTFY